MGNYKKRTPCLIFAPYLMSSPDQLVVTVLESPIMVTAIAFYYFRIIQKIPDHVCERLSCQRLRNQDRFKIENWSIQWTLLAP